VDAFISMIIIGLVAVPAGGKSTVAGYLADLGVTWVNADRIAHEVLQFPEIASQVIDHFGQEIIGKDGKIDHAALGKRVFGDDDLSKQGLRYLESIIHPMTRKIILERLTQADKNNAPGVVLDVPLLLEGSWANQCDEVWFIDSPRSVQAAEAKRRGWSMDNLGLRQARQLPVEEKRRLSTRLIPNDGTLEDLQSRVEKIWTDCVQATALDAFQLKAENHCHPSRSRDH